MDIGEIRDTLEKQVAEALETTVPHFFFKTGRDRAIEQVRNDIQTLDEIMARNFGMAYNSDLKIYE